MAAPKHDEPVKRLKKINLLVQEGFEHSPTGKVLAWLLSAGRAIVIITELVVITAFISRFWLDRELTDLVEENNAKKTQVEASANFEKDFQNTQTRLAAVKLLDNAKTSPSEHIKEVTKLLPAEVVLSDITYNENSVSVTGLSLNEAGLAGFMKSLEKSNKFASVNLVNISLQLGTANLINFSLKIEVEKKVS